MNKLMHQSSKTQPIRTSKIQQATMTQTLLPPLQAKAAIIGDNVIVGHTVVLQGCIVEDEAFIGMGVTLLDGVYVEKHVMVVAGALVKQHTRIPCGEVEEAHAAENAKPLDEIETVKVLGKKVVRPGDGSVLGAVQDTPPEINLPK
ncbi:hypothetical protein KIW84_073381 [Lathyrus oleraceus]|uniref:Uncharacterized protein n=2 Tax=Pisum sativum TaxID=3888 RepID=A0A9D4ZWK2_PEA|nr:hypothetical protein KIW84_073378 [Pisum sativum]KAI5387216.1 hypothetical protein KIW84_073381 [Pisum sativum]